MRNRSPIVSLLALGMLGFCALAPRVARADGTCNVDTDCAKGFSCQVTGSAGCAIDCPPNADCKLPPECINPPVYKSCEPAPCKADSDCAADMVCFSSPGACTAVACAPGQTCPQPSCEPPTSQCIPRYQAPCTVAADCGAGFNCVENQACACAGSGTAGGSSGGSSAGGASGGSPGSAGAAGGPEIPPDVCECGPSGTSSCQAIIVNCQTNADCAAGWTCESFGTLDVCGGPTPEPGGASGGTGGTAGAAGAPGTAGAGNTPGTAGTGGTPTPDCPPTTAPTKQCMPPYYSVNYGSGGATSGGGSGETGGSTTISTGEAGKSNTGTGASTGTVTNDNPMTPAGDKTSRAAGCSVALGTTGTSSGGALLAALALLGLARRRRSTAR